MNTQKKATIAFAVATVLGCLFAQTNIPVAHAVPSFARQTGLGCDSCHTNFPQLTPFGRQFKAHGYLLTNNADSWNKGLLDDNNLPHLAFMVDGGFTRTNKGQEGGAAPGFGDNNNWALNQLSFFYGGIVVPDFVGAFIQGTYNGPNGSAAYWSLDNADLRLARDLTVGGNELVLGFSANNNPTVQDLWNTTPAWSFPYMTSVLGPSPAASALIQEDLAQQVAGTSVYAFYDQHLYAELGAYYALPYSAQRAIGLQKDDVLAQNEIKSAAPYWRLAYQQDWGDQNIEIGTFGLAAPIYPQRISDAGSDWITDVGFDSQYQWLPDPHTVVVQSSLINEFQNLNTSQKLGLSSKSSNQLYSFALSGMYMFDKTYAGTIGFQNWFGPKNADFYGTDTGAPDTDSWIFEVDWLPFNKDGGPWFWPKSNLKLSLQYIAYSQFNGSSRNASDNNTLFFNGWLAF